MKNQMTVAVIVPVVITLGIQTYMMFQLTGQINQLSGPISQVGNPPMALPNLPTLTPPEPGCGNGFFEGHIESL